MPGLWDALAGVEFETRALAAMIRSNQRHLVEQQRGYRLLRTRTRGGGGG